MKLLAVAILVMWFYTVCHAQCPAVKLVPGQAVTFDCKVVRIYTDVGGKRWVEYRGRRELVDCTKATKDPWGGWYDYNLRRASGRIWCPEGKSK